MAPREGARFTVDSYNLLAWLMPLAISHGSLAFRTSTGRDSYEGVPKDARFAL